MIQPVNWGTLAVEIPAYSVSTGEDGACVFCGMAEFAANNSAVGDQSRLGWEIGRHELCGMAYRRQTGISAQRC